ncbi:hypothetical protein Zmor_002908 [Zophobas morio]|uniref:Uncharacterized protein n=1 Tax=Zophobas morio TaxID=2755281 RepID=A0AA38HKC4_9CUCU|nr:hypothetical protein Zmor_002908 [Zophobas morio]
MKDIPNVGVHIFCSSSAAVVLCSTISIDKPSEVIPCVPSSTKLSYSSTMIYQRGTSENLQTRLVPYVSNFVGEPSLIKYLSQRSLFLETRKPAIKLVGWNLKGDFHGVWYRNTT